MQKDNNLDINFLVSKEILGICAYVPGKPIEDVKRELNLKSVIKLASNENPFGCSPLAIKAIKTNLTQINRYPDGNCYYLKNELARFLKVDKNSLVFGNGSDEIIDIIIKTFVSQDEEVLTADVTFLEYKVCSQVNRKIINTVPLSNFKFDLDAILKKITTKTKLIFIANPNNPTGTYLSKDELENFIDKIPRNVIVVIDEAYFEFAQSNDYSSLIDYVYNNNLIILRTFSKAYGLAGLRIGYGVARKEFIDIFNRVRQPFNINSLAQAAAIAALKDQKFIKRVVNENFEQKQFLYDALRKLNIDFVPSEANFILVNVKGDGVEFSKKMILKGIIVRDMEQYGLKNFIRITIGKECDNRLFIKNLEEIL